jgi:hypothetical protein
MKVGFYIGANSINLPSILTDKPTTASKNVDLSLLNGFNGLGYGAAFNIGAILKYPFSRDFYFGGDVDYTSWKSENNCNCTDVITKSVNTLSLYHFGVFSQYFLVDNLYVTPELGLNIFGVKVTENSSRGKIDFSKNYTRLGLGISLGYELPLAPEFSVDFTIKGHIPNLLLTSENKVGYVESESLVNSIGETKEATIVVLSFNLVILFSL